MKREAIRRRRGVLDVAMVVRKKGADDERETSGGLPGLAVTRRREDKLMELSPPGNFYLIIIQKGDISYPNRMLRCLGPHQPSIHPTAAGHHQANPSPPLSHQIFTKQ